MNDKIVKLEEEKSKFSFPIMKESYQRFVCCGDRGWESYNNNEREIALLNDGEWVAYLWIYSGSYKNIVKDWMKGYSLDYIRGKYEDVVLETDSIKLGILQESVGWVKRG